MKKWLFTKSKLWSFLLILLRGLAFHQCDYCKCILPYLRNKDTFNFDFETNIRKINSQTTPIQDTITVSSIQGANKLGANTLRANYLPRYNIFEVT